MKDFILQNFLEDPLLPEMTGISKDKLKELKISKDSPNLLIDVIKTVILEKDQDCDNSIVARKVNQLLNK
jgi:hypothetical protein